MAADNNQKELEDFETLIEKFNKIRIQEVKGKTFLNIIKRERGYLEDDWSNILAFYIDPNEEHQLSDLMLKSIFEAAEQEYPTTKDLKTIEVMREYPTEAGGRIDIVVCSSDTFALGIENKVKAGCYNNLKDYATTIDNLAPSKEQSYKILLSLNTINCDDNGFDNIVYSKLVKTIKKNIGNFATHSDTKYLVFLLDFIKNIEYYTGGQIMNDNPELVSFFHEHGKEIYKLIQREKEICEWSKKQVEEIWNILQEDEKIKRVFGNTLSEGITKWNENNYYIPIKHKINKTTIEFCIGTVKDEGLSFYFGWYHEEDSKLNAELKAKLHKATGKKNDNYKDYPITDTPSDIAKDIKKKLDAVIAAFNLDKK